jgi:uncharacterized protein
VEAVEVAFPGDKVQLSGTITCSGGSRPHPGVVLVGGSGPSDRHNDGLFDSLRDHLAGTGVAVLAYDKRGTGQSTGAWPAATVDELAADAAAAVAALQAHPRVARGAVGVLGHSEGGWVALRLCARLGAPAHLILNSDSAVSFLESEVFALTNAGVEQQTARSIMERLATAMRAGRGHQEGQRILGAYQNEPWYPALDGFTLDEVTWAQFSAWAGFDPASDLARLETPTLAIFGESDPLTPVQASVARHHETAARTGRLQHTVVFAGADHRLRTSAGFAPGYLDLLSRWCHKPGMPG